MRTGRAPRSLLAIVGALSFGAGLMAAVSSASAPARQVEMRGVPRELAAGHLLVAARRVRDGNFRETVVLLFAYSQKDGAAGLIVNRKTTVPARRVLPDLTGGDDDQVVFFGGPVEPASIRGLLRSPLARPGMLRVLPDVMLVATNAALDSAVEDGATADRLRLFGGYAGWSPGQLEREFQRGDWFLTKGGGADVFAPDPERLWSRLIRLADVLEA